MRKTTGKTWGIIAAAVAGVAVVAAVAVNGRQGQPEVHAGQAFTVGSVQVADGWKVTPNDAKGTKASGTLKYTGNGVAESPWLLTLKFWNGKDEIKDASVNCTTHGVLQPGASGTFECGPSDLHKFTYDRITAEKY